MKTEKTQTETYILTEVDRCDPITVYVTNYEPGKGKIVIESYCSAYAAFWGGMGNNSLQEFFLRANNDYILDKLLMETTQTDFDKIAEMASERGFDLHPSSDVEVAMMSNEMYKCFGSYWHMEMPSCSTPECNRLDRIITAIRESFEAENNGLKKAG